MRDDVKAPRKMFKKQSHFWVYVKMKWNHYRISRKYLYSHVHCTTIPPTSCLFQLPEYKNLSHSWACDHALDCITCCFVLSINQLIMLTNYTVIQFLKGGIIPALPPASPPLRESRAQGGAPFQGSLPVTRWSQGAALPYSPLACKFPEIKTSFNDSQ